MAVEITYHSDAREKGAEFYISGLGTVINGKAVTFDDDTQDAYEQQRGMTVLEALKDDENFSAKKVASVKTEIANSGPHVVDDEHGSPIPVVVEETKDGEN